jgi:peptidoglycan/LPS O-acetylase OafA/YrhL
MRFQIKRSAQSRRPKRTVSSQKSRSQIHNEYRSGHSLSQLELGMQARSHLVIASVLSVGGAFFLSDTLGSGIPCGVNIACGQVANFQFLTLGLLFFFIAGLEIIMMIKRRRTGATLWETEYQTRFRRYGIAALAVGAILAIYGLVQLDIAYEILFYCGVLIAAIGASLILTAALTDIKPEKWQTRVIVPAKA